MRILIISQYYPPENAVIPSTIARALAAKGHQVRVLTGYPNYPEGRIFDGYGQRWRTRESDRSVDILRVPLWIDHSQSGVRRTINYVSFGLSATTAFDFARGADVIYVYATQMTPALAPWLWRVIGGAPYVLHVQDLWPDSITGSSLIRGGRTARAVDSILTPWLSSVYRHAAAVIGIAPTMVDTLIARGVHSRKAHLVFNWADEQSLPSSGPEEALSRREGTTILYAGNVGDMQDLETAVRAAHRSRDAGVRLTIVGGGVALPRIRAVAELLGSENIAFKERVPREQMGRYFLAADYALVSLKDLPTFRGTIPSKLQAALSHGKPVISTVQGDVRTFVEEFSVGFTADAEDVDSLESAFRRAAALGEQERKSMAERARSAYLSEFSLDAGVAAVEEILQIASRSRARQGSETHSRGDVHATG
jgi:colanic acid biosynthesis glycosyl transferase WcaI